MVADGFGLGLGEGAGFGRGLELADGAALIVSW